MRVSGWLRRQLATQCVIHTVDEQSIAGYLEEVARDGVILRAATHLGETRVEIGGEVWVPRARIAWVQVIRYGDADSDSGRTVRPGS